VEGNYSAARPLVLEHWDMAIWLDEARPTVTRHVLWNGNRERYANLFSLKPSAPFRPGAGRATPSTAIAMAKKGAMLRPIDNTRDWIHARLWSGSWRACRPTPRGAKPIPVSRRLKCHSPFAGRYVKMHP